MGSNPEKTGQFRQLKWALQALAADAPYQLALFPDFVCKTDELVLDFDVGRSVVSGNYPSDLTIDQAAALAALDAKIGRMSRCGPEYDEDCWTDEALERRSEWVVVRNLARQALTTFKWPEDLPPTDPADRGVTFVPGKQSRDESA